MKNNKDITFKNNNKKSESNTEDIKEYKKIIPK